MREIGYETGRSKQAPFPFVRVPSVDVIAAAGDKLWKEFVGTSTSLKVNHISLAFAGIEIAEQGQKSIEGFLKSASANSSKKKRPDHEQDGSPDLYTKETESNHQDDTASDVQTSEHQSPVNHDLSYSCSRCGKIFYPPDNLTDADDDIRREALSSIRLEHQDFHFAEDLMKESEEHIPPVTTQSNKSGFRPGPSKKKSRNQPQGLDKYFTKK
jgi:DNA polymerase eta